MRNRRREQLLPIAYEKLNSIANDGKIDSGLRSQISAFGVAIKNSSLIEAVACYSKQGNARTPRQDLLVVIYKILIEARLISVEQGRDLKSVVLSTLDNSDQLALLREQIIDASVAIKLAMNFYILEREDDQNRSEESANE